MKLKQIILLLFLALLTSQTYSQRSDELLPDEDVEAKQDARKEQREAKRDPNRKNWARERLVLGGNLNLGFFQGWNISVSPQAGYKLHRNFVLGLATTYSFSNIMYGGGYSDNLHLFGGGPFMRFRPFGKNPGSFASSIFAQAEFEYLWGRAFQKFNGETTPYDPIKFTPSMFMGLGYTDNFDAGFGYYFTVSYNLLWVSNTNRTGTVYGSAYASPLAFRAGFTYSF